MKICVVAPNQFMYISGQRSWGLNIIANLYELCSIKYLRFKYRQRIKTVNKM